MALRRRETQEKGPARQTWLGRTIGWVVALSVRIAFGAAVIAVIAAGLVYLRLSQGPIHLPFAARFLTEAFNADSAQLEAEVGDVVLTIGGRGAPAGVQLVDFRVTNAAGEPLFSVPRMTAKLDMKALLQGHFRPIRIALIRPEARMQRTRDGSFRFGLGEELEPIESTDAGAVETPQTAVISRVLDGLVGDAEPVPELSRLIEIIVSAADFTYENQATGRTWHTSRANLRVFRVETGLLARLEVGLAGETGAAAGETAAGVVITADRRRGSGGPTRVDLRFDGLRPVHLADELDEMQWLRLFDAPLDGSLGATVHPDGRVEGLTGRVAVRGGRILAIEEQGQRFDSIELAFAYAAGLERMQVSELTLVAPAVDTRLTGFVDLVRDAGGEVGGLAGQFEIEGLHVDVPQAFAEPLQFDGGQIAAKLNFVPMAIEATEAHLRSGDLVLAVSGSVRESDGDWHTDLRAAGRNLTIAQMLRHWPVVAAENTRRWVERNIRQGDIDEAVAHMRFGGGEPRLNLDFAFSGVEADYLAPMTPIRNAHGRGNLTLRQLNLQVDSAEVESAAGAPVSLDGSSLRVIDIQNRPWPAEGIVHAHGPIRSILALINEPPLKLVDQPGLDPASVGGESDVVARLNFPLTGDLGIDDVEVSAEARLHDLKLPFELPGGHVADVRGAELSLRADRQEMRLSGPIRLDGFPLKLDWQEFYGRGADQRRIAVIGDATPALLGRIDLDTEYFTDGRAPMKLLLEQTGGESFGFDLEADLAPARLRVDEFAWTKPPGPAGRLVAEGVFGDNILVPRFRLDTDELKAVGAINFAPGGVMRRADLDRLRFRGVGDVSLIAERRQLAAGRPDLWLKVGGRLLDLAMFDDVPETGASTGTGARTDGVLPLDVVFDVDELVVTPRMIARPGTGTYRRDAAGNATASLQGRMAGEAPFTAEYTRVGTDPADVVLRSQDAGGLLAAADLFPGARGGELTLKGRIAPKQGVDMAGVARMKDVVISSTGTFKSILDEGGAKEAASAAGGSGIDFDKVRVPFTYGDGVMTLDDATAKGTLLAVSLEGTVDENTDKVDLVGAISPAYALTGALDSIPLLGDILTGGKGEGILAMTFKVKGPIDDTKFSVNPFSLLAPGILRSLFSSKGEPPDDSFFDQLHSPDQ